LTIFPGERGLTDSPFVPPPTLLEENLHPLGNGETIFLARDPSYHPTISVKAMKATTTWYDSTVMISFTLSTPSGVQISDSAWIK